MEELLERHRVESVDFLKIDIEGSEFDLFRGAPAWLHRVRRIAMEVHPEFGPVAELARAIGSRGMKVEFRDNGLEAVEAIPAEGGYLYAVR
jgi:hypothetical protein